MNTKILKKSPQILASLFLTLLVSTEAAAGPVALPDHANTTPGVSQTIGVLWNDKGPGLWISDVNDYSQQGGLVYALPGGQKIHYTPKAGFSGTDTFWYVITDAHGRTNSSKVTVNVNGHHRARAKHRGKHHHKPRHRKSYNLQWSQPGLSLSFSKPGGLSAHFEQPSRRYAQPSSGSGPVGYPDTFSTHVSSGQSKLYVLGNDQGHGLSVLSTNPWTKHGGQAWVVNDHSGSYIMYTPKPGYRGSDEVWYVLRDTNGRTNSTYAKISIW